MEIVAKANHVTVMDHEMKSRREHFVPDPMNIPRSIMEQWNPHITDGLPDAFSGIFFLITLDLQRECCDFGILVVIMSFFIDLWPQFNIRISFVASRFCMLGAKLCHFYSW